MENVRFDVVPTDDLPVNQRTRKFQLILDCRGAEPAVTFPLGSVDKAASVAARLAPNETDARR